MGGDEEWFSVRGFLLEIWIEDEIHRCKSSMWCVQGGEGVYKVVKVCGEGVCKVSELTGNGTVGFNPYGSGQSGQSGMWV
jgi:hypothetical protein